MAQVNKISLKDEASVVVAELIAKKELNSALDNMIAELKGISTFTCVDNIPELMAFLEKVKKDNSLANGKEEILFALHLLSLSDSRHEELNGKGFTLQEIEKNFYDKLTRLFGKNAPENTSLFDMATEIKKSWQTLSPEKIRCEKIDGQSCNRLSFILQPEGKPSIQSLWEELQKTIEETSNKDDIMNGIKKVVKELFMIPGTDFVLFSGPIRPLFPKQETTSDDFFSYVFTSTGVSNGKEKSQNIAGVFRGARKRYFDKGYHILLPAFGDNEDCRKEHQPLNFKSFMRTPGNLWGLSNAIDLRCASQDANKYSEKELDLLLGYVKVLEKIVQCAFRKGIVLANQLDANEIIFS